MAHRGETMSFIKRTSLALLCGCCLFTFATPQSVHAANALHLELSALGKDIHKLIDKRGGGKVAVGGFTAASNILGSSGPDVQLQLVAALQKTGLIVNAEDYKYEISGNYLGTTDKETGVFGVKIVARVIDSDGTTLAEFPRFVFGEEVVPRMLGVSVRTNPNDNALKRSVKIKDAMKKPQVHLVNTRIATSADSPYAIEILVKHGNKYIARSAKAGSRGRPFVGIKQDELYAVRLINDSNHAAAVNLSIDGINSFRFSNTTSTYWIVPAHKSVTIKGWHRSKTKSVEFKVTGYTDTAAALLKLKPSATIGQISASFSAAWVDKNDRPHDEAAGRGTGFGDEIQFKTKQVKRIIGHVRDSIIVRYEH